MAKAKDIPNVVEVTNQPGLFEKFEDLQARLTLCEKSLAGYIETERLAFPRFYFVAQADFWISCPTVTIQRSLLLIYPSSLTIQLI